MNKKERKGGALTNTEVEQELQKKETESGSGYHGLQDTGDEVVREKGTATQQEDGTGQANN